MITPKTAQAGDTEDRAIGALMGLAAGDAGAVSFEHWMPH